MNIDFFGEKVIASVSTKPMGNMRLTGHDLYDEPAYENRIRFFESLGISPEQVVSAELSHGAFAEVVGAGPFAPKLKVPKVDTLITGNKGVALTVGNADCFTVFFHDTVNEVVGISHAGWKGILTGVVEAAVLKLETEFNSPAGRIQAFIGPGIQECHFEVGEEVVKLFKPFAKEYSVLRPIPPSAEGPRVDTWHDVKQWRVDLRQAIRERLIQSGVRVANIGWTDHCTYCCKQLDELRTLPERSRFSYQYFSFRRDKSDPLETNVGVIYMKL